MLVSMDLLESNLRDLNHAELIVTVGNIADLGAAHSGLQNVPEDVPGPSVLTELKVDFAASVQAAINGDKVKGEERDAKRLHLLECVIMWGQHIIMRYKLRKDHSVLHNNGFELKKTPAKSASSKIPTPVPTNVRVTYAQSGCLVVTTKQIPGNGTFELRFTTDPSNESSWVDGGHHTECRIERQGFVPATTYYFSLRYHEKNGTSAWCAPVGIIAL